MTKLRAIALGAAVAAGVMIPCVPALASTPASGAAAGSVAAGPVAAMPAGAGAGAGTVTLLPHVVGPVLCRGGNFGLSPALSGNFIANIINGAFDAARVGIDAVQAIADTAVGAPGAGC
jgi:hypothetical protein